MNRQLGYVICMSLVIVLLYPAAIRPALAEDSDLKKPVDVTEAFKKTGKEIREEGRKIGNKIGRTFGKAGREAGDFFKTQGKEIGRNAVKFGKEAGKEFKEAVPDNIPFP